MTNFELQKLVNEYLNKGGCHVNCPVSVNNRLTSTLGRACFIRRAGKWISVKIEFSGKLLREATDRCVMDVLIHEVAHVVANLRTGKDEGHNHVFKAVCHELGTTNDGMYTKVEYKTNLTQQAAPKAKYEVICPNCGVIATFARDNKTIRAIDRCGCRKCGANKLKLRQNW